jgi:hypothetical protein
MNGRKNKRQRLHDEEKLEVDVRLNEELRAVLGGQTYVKAKDLTREILMEYVPKDKAPRKWRRFHLDLEYQGNRGPGRQNELATVPLMCSYVFH